MNNITLYFSPRLSKYVDFVQLTFYQYKISVRDQTVIKEMDDSGFVLYLAIFQE